MQQEAGRVDVFEVFKVGGVQKKELDDTPIEKLRSKYILMKPLTSKEDLNNTTELAQLPPAGNARSDLPPFR